MAVVVKFGNLGIEDLERDLGIKFTEADRKFLQETRQEQVMEEGEALKMPSCSWHALSMTSTEIRTNHSISIVIKS